jgi:hypothetical protein
VLHVRLATLEPGIAPRRLQALQYTTTPTVSAARWAELGAHAARRFEGLVARHREHMREFTGLCEPITLVAPASLASEPRPCLRDAAGAMLALAGGPPILATLEALARDPLAWVVGRLVDDEGSTVLVPLAVAVRRADGIHHARM